MKKFQPTGGTIALLFFMVLVFLSIFLMTLYQAVERGLLYMCIISGVFTVVFFVWGIIAIFFAAQSAKARDYGQNATCIVVDKRVMTNRYGRLPVYYVIVSYVGENGKSYEHQARVNEDFFCRAGRGATLRCRVYKSSCYIDPDSPFFVA